MTCYEVFLGRELENFSVVQDRSSLPLRDILRSVICSDEFRTNVGLSLSTGAPFPHNLFVHPPSIRQRSWAAGLPGVSLAAADRLRSASQWRDLLNNLFGDDAFKEVLDANI